MQTPREEDTIRVSPDGVSFLADETPRAAAAFHEYCLLGYDRTIKKLAEKFGKGQFYHRQLEAWSAKYQWQKRVKMYDAEQAKLQAQAIIEERARILTSRYALMHKRVELLDKLAQQLVLLSQDNSNIWLPTDRGGMNFNADLFREIRASLADIAAEMGERVKVSKQEVSGSLDLSGAKETLKAKLAAFITEEPDTDEVIPPTITKWNG